MHAARHESLSLASIRLLISIRELQELLFEISYVQLLSLTNNMIPPSSEEIQLQFINKIQEIFQGWSSEMLKQLNGALINCALHCERQQLLSMEPSIPWECLHFLIELLKMPFEELESFKNWFSSLSQNKQKSSFVSFNWILLLFC